MPVTSLREFIAQVLEDGRIGFGDLKRLQRHVLPGGVTSREDAELLISLDAAVLKADRDWPDYLIGAVSDFVVWGVPPLGSLDQEKTEWLSAALSRGSPSTARFIARSVASAACRDEPSSQGPEWSLSLRGEALSASMHSAF